MHIRDFIKPYGLTIFIIIALTFGQVIADLLLPNYMADIVDRGIALCDTSVILDRGEIMLLVALAGIICAVSAGYYDSRTEILVQQAMTNIMDGHTSFVIAHRLSTIRDADNILVMDEGNIIEQGNHKELLAKKGFYYELYNSQFIGEQFLFC